MTLATALVGLDDWLIDRVFQKLTDRLGEKPSAFDIGISLELGAVVLELAADVGFFAIGRLGWNAALWDGFSCACGLWCYVFISRQRHLVRATAMNPLRELYRAWRLLALAFACWSLGSVVTADPLARAAYAFDALSNFAFTAGIYLISCQPRPPGWRVAQRRRAPQLGVVPNWG